MRYARSSSGRSTSAKSLSPSTPNGAWMQGRAGDCIWLDGEQHCDRVINLGKAVLILGTLSLLAGTIIGFLSKHFADGGTRIRKCDPALACCPLLPRYMRCWHETTVSMFVTAGRPLGLLYAASALECSHSTSVWNSASSAPPSYRARMCVKHNFLPFAVSKD